MCSTPSLWSFPSVIFETVPMFVWLMMALSRPFKEDCLALPLPIPLSTRWSIDGVMPFASCLQVVSPQHFTSSACTVTMHRFNCLMSLGCLFSVFILSLTASTSEQMSWREMQMEVCLLQLDGRCVHLSCWLLHYEYLCFFSWPLCLCFLLLLFFSLSLFVLFTCWQKSETEWGPQALVQNQQTRDLILESRHDFQRKLWWNNKLIKCVSLPTRSCIELPQTCPHNWGYQNPCHILGIVTSWL